MSPSLVSSHVPIHVSRQTLPNSLYLFWIPTDLVSWLGQSLQPSKVDGSYLGKYIHPMVLTYLLAISLFFRHGLKYLVPITTSYLTSRGSQLSALFMRCGQDSNVVLIPGSSECTTL